MSVKITAPLVRAKKARGEKIAMVTAYDATFARLLEAGGAEILLVGDSLGMVVQGLATTLPVTLEEMLYHGRAVARGAKHAQVVGDLPFMSYQLSPEQALASAGRMLKEGSFEAVKLEGGERYAEHVRAIVGAGIPVMGHVGLLPQSVHAMGGFKVQGKSDPEQIVRDARALEQAGVYGIVLEGIPAPLAKRITESVAVPTLGIGAGPDCDGQVLVCYDLLGMVSEIHPKFVKHFGNVGQAIVEATRSYVGEVKSGAFPTAAHSFGLKNGPPHADEATGARALVEGVPAPYGPASDES